MCRGARSFRKKSPVGILLAGLMAAAPSAHADDIFSGLTPLSESQLQQNSGQGVTIEGNTFVNNATSESGSVDHTFMNGQFTNGNVNNNTVSGNQGLTSVMVNTGNNVNLNNSFTVNVIMH